MENRFTIKDLFVVLLMIVLIITVVLAMFQYDRQWKSVKSLEKQLAQLNSATVENGRELKAIHKLLEQPNRETPITRLPSIPSDPIASGARTAPPPRNTQSAPAPTAQNSLATAKGDPFKYQAAAAAEPDYARGDWLIQNFGTKVGKLTPLLSSDVYASIVQNRIMESLAYRDPETLEWLPLLATDWQVSEDGLQIRVQLRRGVQFSDGTPFTADDLVFTFEWIRNPLVAAPRQRSGYEPLDTLEKVNDFEVLFKFKRPYFEALSLALGTQPMSKAFYSKYKPEDFNQSVGAVIGTGPYQLADPESWRPGMPIMLIRNERYWGMAAPFNRIYFREIEEDAAALTMFRNGETDTFGAQPEQYVALKDDPEIQKKSNRFEYYFRDGGYNYIAWNQRRVGKPTLFSDKRIRQAMTMLINRERIVRDVYLGYAKPSVGPFGVVSPQNDPEIQPWPFDVKRATQILSDAGFKSKNDRGVLVDDSGREFRFKLTYPNKSPIYERVALAAKDSYARLGIVLEQEPTDWPVMLKKLETRDYDAIALGWTGGVETDIYQMFHSENIKDNGDNFMSYSNPELDKAIEEARATVDPEKRMPIWRRAHRIIHEDQPYTFLIIGQALQFIDKRIQNVERTKSGLNFFGQDVMPIPWYVPREMQKHVD